MPDSALVVPEQPGYVVVINGLLRSMTKIDRVARCYLHLAHQPNISLVGICTESFVLAQEGFPNGLMATIYPRYLNDFKMQFPQPAACSGVDFVKEKGILACPRGISMIGLAIELIYRHCGPDGVIEAIFQMSILNRIDSTSMAISRVISFTRVSDSRLRKVVFPTK